MVVHRHRAARHDAHLGLCREFTAQESLDARRTLYADDSLPVLRAARARGIEWLYAIRRPDSRAPSRAAKDFPGVDSVHELAEGLALQVAAHQFAGGP